GKATIIIEKVEDDFAVAKLLDGDSIEINDRVEIKQPSINNGLEGLVRIKNEKLIAIDIGTRKGAQVGQRFKITRDGKSVTEVILKELYDDWALVEPIDETKSSEIAVGDKVIELKSSPQ
ncbi:hypothetical protein HY605_03350, partial [Candidatus Peregrinibacteria bacterium]|nr:hypothetical protein [Candidatus Peregrinibacteria bacterium]